MSTPKSKKVELLALAGNLEKLEIAIHYGADVVYFVVDNLFFGINT
jgi:collagenase-like PrtC family protease